MDARSRSGGCRTLRRAQRPEADHGCGECQTLRQAQRPTRCDRSITGGRRPPPTTGRRTPPRRHRAPARYGRAPRSPTSDSDSAAKCERAMATGCPGTPRYTACTSGDPSRSTASTRATAAGAASGVSTGVMTTASHPPDDAAARPARSVADKPSAQSATVTTVAGRGTRAATSSADAPTRTMTSSQPPSRNMSTAVATHGAPSAPRTRPLGCPYRRAATRGEDEPADAHRPSAPTYAATYHSCRFHDSPTPFSRQRSAPETRRG